MPSSVDSIHLHQVPVAPAAVTPASSATAHQFDQSSAQKQENRAPVEPHKENIQVEDKTLSLGFSVDSNSHAIKIRITNQKTGELVREFELKGLPQAHHDRSTTKGVIVDDQT